MPDISLDEINRITLDRLAEFSGLKREEGETDLHLSMRVFLKEMIEDDKRITPFRQRK